MDYLNLVLHLTIRNVRVCKYIQVHKVGNLLPLIHSFLTSLSSNSSSLLSVCYFSLSLSLLFPSRFFFFKLTRHNQFERKYERVVTRAAIRDIK